MGMCMSRCETGNLYNELERSFTGAALLVPFDFVRERYSTEVL
jgi:hypothetical protein